jgi:hypothetical protein
MNPPYPPVVIDDGIRPVHRFYTQLPWSQGLRDVATRRLRIYIGTPPSVGKTYQVIGDVHLLFG